MITPPTPQDHVISTLEKAGWVCDEQPLNPKLSCAYDESIGSGGYCGRYWPETVTMRRGYGVILITSSEVFIDNYGTVLDKALTPLKHDFDRPPHARSSQMSIRAAQQLLCSIKPY